MLDGLAQVDQLFERVDADAQVRVRKFLRDFSIASGCLDSTGDHRLV